MKMDLEKSAPKTKSLTLDDLKKVTGGMPPRDVYKTIQNGCQVELPA